MPYSGVWRSNFALIGRCVAQLWRLLGTSCVVLEFPTVGDQGSSESERGWTHAMDENVCERESPGVSDCQGRGRSTGACTERTPLNVEQLSPLCVHTLLSFLRLVGYSVIPRRALCPECRCHVSFSDW